MSEEKLPPIHSGEILLEEFLKPMGLSQYRLAKDINVPAPVSGELFCSNSIAAGSCKENLSSGGVTTVACVQPGLNMAKTTTPEIYNLG